MSKKKNRQKAELDTWKPFYDYFKDKKDAIIESFEGDKSDKHKDRGYNNKRGKITKPGSSNRGESRLHNNTKTKLSKHENENREKRI